MKRTLVCLLAFLAMLQLMFESGQSLTCTEVNKSVLPCVSYLTGGVDKPAPECCAGVLQLKLVATTTELKRMACNCIKQAASHYSNLKDSAISDLPSKCGTTISFSVSRNTNCNK
ncbi:hypothetical protein IFM89_028141 [Coptis chinensis]|uniref:Non-specific lipid-transfer protein n=1 Tax=Coptis chinensis TaxID=261450 RepID=A0A835HVC8_9MAGN|nr:hypothetical protein IFM89_028141 [Coptis chinensis]